MHVDVKAAIPYFRKAIEIEPSNFQAHQALGYAYNSTGQLEDALGEFQTADHLKPSDTLKLQIAFTMIALQQDTASDKILQELTRSSSPDIQKKANDQLRYRSAGGASVNPWWTRIYSADFYDTRWQTTFLSLTAEEGYNFAKVLSAYGVLDLSADTKSSTGAVPEIFSDNTVMLGIGVRAALFTGFAVSAQEAAAFDLIGRHNVDFPQEDFRLFATYGYGIYAPYTLHSDARFPFYPTLDLYSSLGAYSRYKTTIGYLQVKFGLRALEVSKTVFDIFGKVNFARDWAMNILRSNSSFKAKEFYNNIDEWGGGCRLTPDVDWGVYIDATYMRGFYSHGDLVPEGRDRYYNSFRLYLIVDRTF